MFTKHAHELNNCTHCDCKKHMENKDARKGDMSVNEVRNIIIDCFDGFPEYMMMKLQSTEIADKERIEESINISKDYMLKKIKE